METVVLILFLLIAALIIGSAVMVVAVRDVIHSALWLISSFFGIGALYLLLEAEFLAVVQVLVYVGAISILILFAIMLTRHAASERERRLNNRWWLALLVAGVLFAAVLVPTVASQPWSSFATSPPVAPGQAAPVAGPAEIGTGFVREFFLQFQVAGILLFVALIGAIVVASEARDRRGRILTLAEEHELRKRRQQAAEAPDAAPAPEPAALSPPAEQ